MNKIGRSLNFKKGIQRHLSVNIKQNIDDALSSLKKADDDHYYNFKNNEEFKNNNSCMSNKKYISIYLHLKDAIKDVERLKGIIENTGKLKEIELLK